MDSPEVTLQQYGIDLRRRKKTRISVKKPK